MIGRFEICEIALRESGSGPERTIIAKMAAGKRALPRFLVIRGTGTLIDILAPGGDIDELFGLIGQSVVIEGTPRKEGRALVIDFSGIPDFGRVK